MDNKNQNPLHMPHIQILRLLVQHGYSGDLEEILDLLEEESRTDPERIQKMIDEWNSQLYSSKSINYLLMSIFDYFPQVHRASLEAQAVLLLMVRTQEQATGLVEVQKGIYAKVLGWGSKKAGRIKDCLLELEKIQAIFAIYSPPDGSTKPGIYQINSRFSKIGKHFKAAPIINQKTDYSQYSHTVSLLINGQKRDFRCGSIQKVVNVDDDKKKRVSADQNTDSTESHSDSEPHSHSTELPAENQAENTTTSGNNMPEITGEELLEL